MKAVNTLAGEKKQSVPIVILESHVGEMNTEEVAETLMDPDNRIIHQVTVEDEVKASTLFEQMMGSSPTPRKQFLKDYSEESYYNVE